MEGTYLVCYSTSRFHSIPSYSHFSNSSSVAFFYRLRRYCEDIRSVNSTMPVVVISLWASTPPFPKINEELEIMAVSNQRAEWIVGMPIPEPNASPM